MYGIISFPDMLTCYHFVLVPQQENFSQGFIFFIAEFDKRDLPKSTWTRWVEWLESKKISWVNWSISDKNETCSMILPRANKNGGWDESLIKPAGRQSRKFIRQYNSHIYKNKE